MSRSDLYLLKNTGYFFALGNIVVLLFPSWQMALGCNGVALAVSLGLFWLIRLTVRRYAAAFSLSRTTVKELLADYIADEKRGKISFFDYLRQRASTVDSTPSSRHPGTDLSL